MILIKNTEKVNFFDVHKIRKDFPILSRTVNDKPLIYFDNGATTQKPKHVIDAIVAYYITQNANIHRGVHNTRKSFIKKPLWFYAKISFDT
jgi:cysteine desulfurase/selenocysteine lyase